MLSSVRSSALCALAVAGLGCEVHTIGHGPEEVFTTSGTSFASATGGVFPGGSSFFGDSNYPEPAQTVCGGLEDMSLPIQELNSAWGVEAVVGAHDEPGSIRVRLAERAVFDCDDMFVTAPCEPETSSTSGSGACGWGFAFTLSPDEAKATLLQLDALSDPQFELVTDEGSVEVVNAVGALELYRVTQDCIVGELSDLDLEVVPAVALPTLEGGFVAQLCRRTCLPTSEVACE